MCMHLMPPQAGGQLQCNPICHLVRGVARAQFVAAAAGIGACCCFTPALSAAASWQPPAVETCNPLVKGAAQAQAVAAAASVGTRCCFTPSPTAATHWRPPAVRTHRPLVKGAAWTQTLAAAAGVGARCCFTPSLSAAAGWRLPAVRIHEPLVGRPAQAQAVNPLTWRQIPRQDTTAKAMHINDCTASCHNRGHSCCLPS